MKTTAYNFNRVTMQVTIGVKPEGDDWIVLRDAKEFYPVFDRIDRLMQTDHTISCIRGSFRLLSRKGAVVLESNSYRGLAVAIVLAGL